MPSAPEQVALLNESEKVSEVAPVFAGEPLPTKLKARKAEYVSGLKAADKGNLKILQQLVLECFEQQVAEISLMLHK